MAQTVAGVVEKPVDAQRLIDELVRDCLCDRADISVIARDAARASAEKASARANELKGVTLRAREASPEMMHTIHKLAEDIRRQVKRHREKRRKRRRTRRLVNRARGRTAQEPSV